MPLLLPAEIVPELLMPPEKVWTVKDVAEFGPVPALPPVTMPLANDAAIVPELLMPPEKADTCERECLADVAEIVPELLMPPVKVGP